MTNGLKISGNYNNNQIGENYANYKLIASGTIYLKSILGNGTIPASNTVTYPYQSGNVIVGIRNANLYASSSSVDIRAHSIGIEKKTATSFGFVGPTSYYLSNPVDCGTLEYVVFAETAATPVSGHGLAVYNQSGTLQYNSNDRHLIFVGEFTGVPETAGSYYGDTWMSRITLPTDFSNSYLLLTGSEFFDHDYYYDEYYGYRFTSSFATVSIGGIWHQGYVTSKAFVSGNDIGIYSIKYIPNAKFIKY